MRGRSGSEAIGLRADLDALHIRERTGVAHASQVDGKMHACGHDGHTAMLLGAARYLAENHGELPDDDTSFPKFFETIDLATLPPDVSVMRITPGSACAARPLGDGHDGWRAPTHWRWSVGRPRRRET